MSIVIEQLTKRYEGHPVVSDVSLQVATGEFFVLLGPSGSGKSTILRMIAGLAPVDQGRIHLGGRDVTALPPQQRSVGFVFQNYALFRYMTVGENVEFGLKIRKVPAKQRILRRNMLLELVGLAGLEKRMPRQLSGGQQQRVALARALAYEPAVLLLDEPFGALDAQIRAELRRNLKAIQRELKITTILVTHDQEEAFELADHMGVMNAGHLLEVGPPDELYLRPQTEFVASFLGTANLLVGSATNDRIQVGPMEFPFDSRVEAVAAGQRVQVLFRAEDVALSSSPDAAGMPVLGQGVVEGITFAGSFERLRLRLPPVSGVRPIAPPPPYGIDCVLIDATRSQDQAQRFPLQPGDTAWVSVQHIHAINHPGMTFLIVPNAALPGQPAMAVGGQIAGRAQARATVLAYGLKDMAMTAYLQQAKEQWKSTIPGIDLRPVEDSPAEALDRELERRLYDVVVIDGQTPDALKLVDTVLEEGDAHLMLAPRDQGTPAHALICASPGEPGKDVVRFAGRLVRHLGAAATLLTVAPPDSGSESREGAQRFLDAGARTLKLLGVQSTTMVRNGMVRDEISAQLKAGQYDMLVLGAPLPEAGERRGLHGVVGELLRSGVQCPVLIVRYAEYAPRDARPHGEAHNESYEEAIA